MNSLNAKMNDSRKTLNTPGAATGKLAYTGDDTGPGEIEGQIVHLFVGGYNAHKEQPPGANAPSQVGHTL